MLTPGLESLLRPQIFMMRVVWGAMTFAVLLYGALSFLMVSGMEGGTMPPADFTVMRYMLAATAVVAGLLSLVVSRFVPSEPALRQAASREGDAAAVAANPRSGSTEPTRAAQLAALSVLERRVLAAAPLATVQLVVRLALAESPAIMGFVLVMMGREPAIYLPFGAFSLVLMVLAYPRIESFLERAAARLG